MSQCYGPRPMHEAPKDGKHILILRDDHILPVAEGYWSMVECRFVMPAAPMETKHIGWIPMPDELLVLAMANGLNHERTEVQTTVDALLDIARATWHALEDSRQVDDAEGRHHRIRATDFETLCKAMDVLDALPVNRPGHALTGPTKAGWVLRKLLCFHQ